jgi:hypothetical protein
MVWKSTIKGIIWKLEMKFSRTDKSYPKFGKYKD